ncbi:transcription factor IIA alpha/beta subunit [Punctularia strigosozonata HHB-11173 SS5]|uniref:transcription factor IIA alpha/beta subunit n=1 Tax=Punctularia strigosozonata (strain HHB-11173) TaxID=741275 RepID=UPI000441793B|nr:transcription factor IIA alpha/beta subunit [Punctularia strigosozonata HHB-11173 SS5]EIN11525.1 transcription factor IIA alpha/beta subunit [Punctularia strigosozonata HHB-11173 SS5]
MSNKIVPTIYRAVIDDVIAAIKPEFDEYGVGEEVLAELQSKWETKVIQSGVADFDPAHAMQAPAAHYPPHAMHMQPQQHYNGYVAPPPPTAGPQIKAEPVDNRYILQQPPGMPHYTLPALPGPQITVPQTPRQPAPVASSQSVLSFPAGPANGQSPPAPGAHPYAAAQPSPPSQPRIPQTDGPSSSSGSGSASPPSYAPRSAHPSLPQPSQSQSTEENDPEAINSDLDDSDTENEDDNEEGGQAVGDIVFCTYDKVARVKNKWKCVLKDGMIHVNNKDYLFAKCTGEFEW